MTIPHSYRPLSLIALAGFAAVLCLLSDDAPTKQQQTDTQWYARVGSQAAMTAAEQKQYPDTFTYRIAKRMQRRLRNRGIRQSPSLDTLASAVEQRQQMLSRNVSVHFETEDADVASAWDVSAQRYPLWIQPVFTATSASYSADTAAIARTFEDESVFPLQPPVHAVLTDVSENRAMLDGVAKPGYLPDAGAIAEAIGEAMRTGAEEVSFVVPKIEGRIINASGKELGDFRLLASGRSEYSGSVPGRIRNVEKALNEHVNNSYVLPGETFSFNETLDGPVSLGNGWSMAKIIVNGADLEYAPGGGICQASTTVFRAAVLAGFPIVKRRAHSLYVSYYKEHGVGIDATIYPGSQDLTFVNDTQHPVVIQAYHDGTDAYVNIYGTPDGRTVTLEGPYFTDTAPEGRTIARNEIVWVQQVSYANGEEREYIINSKYRTMPQSLVREFAPQQTVHASAPLAIVVD